MFTKRNILFMHYTTEKCALQERSAKNILFPFCTHPAKNTIFCAIKCKKTTIFGGFFIWRRLREKTPTANCLIFALFLPFFRLFSWFYGCILLRLFPFYPFVCVRCCLTIISQNEIKKGIKKEGGVLPHPFF